MKKGNIIKRLALNGIIAWFTRSG